MTMPDRPDATLGKTSRARQNAPESTYQRTSTADESASAHTDDTSSAHGRDPSTADPMSRAKETLSNTVSQAGEKVASRLDTEKDRAAEGLGSVAQALRQASSQLQGPNQPAAAQQYIASAANQIDRLSSYLRSTNT